MTFDIDRNGIVNVTAKDKEKAGANYYGYFFHRLTETDIDRLVKEAEEHAEEDRKKEAIELRNNADNAIWATERTLKELGDKVTADQKAEVSRPKRH